MSPALESWNLNHCTTREVSPDFHFLNRVLKLAYSGAKQSLFYKKVLNILCNSLDTVLK